MIGLQCLWLIMKIHDVQTLGDHGKGRSSKIHIIADQSFVWSEIYSPFVILYKIIITQHNLERCPIQSCGYKPDPLRVHRSSHFLIKGGPPEMGPYLA